MAQQVQIGHKDGKGKTIRVRATKGTIDDRQRMFLGPTPVGGTNRMKISPVLVKGAKVSQDVLVAQARLDKLQAKISK